MTMSEIIKYITNYAARNESFSASDLLKDSGFPYLTKRTVMNSYLSKLTNEGKLQRVGRGTYVIGYGNHCFNPEIGEKSKRLYEFLKQEFPLVNMCVYEGQWITPFMHHLANNQAVYLEVEKDVSEYAFHKIKELEGNVFYRPDKKEIEKYLDLSKGPIIIKNLVTESPLCEQKGLHIPTLEKLLVDMYCDSDFYYLQGEEYWRIMHNAHQYVINTSKMFRYASRRNALQEIKRIWEESINDFE